MAGGRKLDNASYNVTTDWESETESKDILKKGWYNIEFSNMDNTNESVILAGSSIDIDGVVYVFDSDETPIGSEAAGTNYIRVYDSSSTALAEYTQTTPEDYDYDKKGYYDSTGLKRYILQFEYDNSSEYNLKEITDINININNITTSNIMLNKADFYDLLFLDSTIHRPIVKLSSTLNMSYTNKFYIVSNLHYFFNGSVLYYTNSDSASSVSTGTSGTANTLNHIGADGGRAYGIICADGGYVGRSTDGTTFSSVTSGTTNNLNWIYQGVSMATNRPVIVGDGGVITRSIDDGASWATVTSGTANNLNCVISENGNDEYIAVGNSGTIISSSDYGATWSNVSSPVTNNLTYVTTTILDGVTKTYISGYDTLLRGSLADGFYEVSTENIGIVKSDLTIKLPSGKYALIFFGSSGMLYTTDGFNFKKERLTNGAVWSPFEALSSISQFTVYNNNYGITADDLYATRLLTSL